MTLRARNSFVAGLAALLCGVGSAGPAAAVSFIECGQTLAQGILPNTGCTGITGVSNDSASVMNTSPGAFGRTDWVSLGRDNADPEPGDIDIFQTTGDGFVSGTWSFDPADIVDFASFRTLSIVLKSAAQAEPCGIAAYRLPGGTTSGTYQSGFLCPQGEPQAISHITLYGSVTPAPVPLPASLMLLIGGLGGLGVLTARRRRS